MCFCESHPQKNKDPQLHFTLTQNATRKWLQSSLSNTSGCLFFSFAVHNLTQVTSAPSGSAFAHLSFLFCQPCFSLFFLSTTHVLTFFITDLKHILSQTAVVRHEHHSSLEPEEESWPTTSTPGLHYSPINLMASPSLALKVLFGQGDFCSPKYTCNNTVLLTAVWSCSKARTTTAAVFRKKHLKDIRRLGSDFKWKLNQGVKSLWLCSSSHYSLLLWV